MENQFAQFREYARQRMLNRGISPPCYPLDRETFDRALTLGHGRAMIHAQRYGTDSYKDLILDAALYCRVKDTCVEADPPVCYSPPEINVLPWALARLCHMAGLVPQLMEAEKTIVGTMWNAYQFQFLHHEWIGMGIIPPQEKSTNRGGQFSDEWQEHIEEKGASAMIECAQALGEELRKKNHSNWRDASDAVEWYEELHGVGSATDLLMPLAAHDTAILRFLRVHRSNCLRDARVERAEEIESAEATADREEDRMTWQKLWQQIHSDEMELWNARHFLEDSGYETHRAVQQLLYDSKKTEVLTNACLCMGSMGLADFDPALLTLLTHGNRNLREVAAQVLGNHDEPSVRKAGIRALTRGEHFIACELLRKTARNGDSQWLIDIALHLSDPQNYEDSHEAFYLPLTLFAENPHLTEPLIPLFVYEFSPCSRCRGKAFRYLIERSCCPSWVLEEAEWDAVDAIRELAKQVRNSAISLPIDSKDA